MKNKGFSTLELILVVVSIGVLAFTVFPNLPSVETIHLRQVQQRKAQIISVDEKGNELWRVYDEEIGRYIYYMPKGETSWKVPSGKTSEPMGVR